MPHRHSHRLAATMRVGLRIAEAAPVEEHPGRLRRFVRDWISRVWPSSAQASETTQDQTSAQAQPAGQPSPPLDAVLTGVIIRYEDRHGTALSARLSGLCSLSHQRPRRRNALAGALR